MPTLAMSDPLIVPMTRPRTSAPAMPKGTPAASEMAAARHPLAAAVAPTDRSKPPEMIINCIPQATIPTIEACWMMLSRLAELRTFGFAIERPMMLTTNSRSMTR
jgi:hypothetical protein